MTIPRCELYCRSPHSRSLSQSSLAPGGGGPDAPSAPQHAHTTGSPHLWIPRLPLCGSPITRDRGQPPPARLSTAPAPDARWRNRVSLAQDFPVHFRVNNNTRIFELTDGTLSASTPPPICKRCPRKIAAASERRSPRIRALAIVLRGPLYIGSAPLHIRTDDASAVVSFPTSKLGA